MKTETKIILTEQETENLYSLVRESCDTGNELWDQQMKDVLKKIEKALHEF